MAYSATITKSERIIQGIKTIVVSVIEAEAASTDEFEITGLPAVGRIMMYNATLISGTATTIAPIIGRATGWSTSTQDAVGAVGAAAAYQHTTTAIPFVCSGSLFIRSTSDAATADGVIHSEFVIVEGLA